MIKSIGGIIKLNRCQANLSLKAVGQELNLSESYISRVERNKEVLSLENAKRIFLYLGIDYCEEDIDEQFEQDFYAFYKDVVLTNDYLKSYQVILSYEDKIKSTCSYIKFLLAEIVYKIMIAEYNNPKDYEYIEDYFGYLEDYQKQIYYDYMGVLLGEMMNRREAIIYFDKALSYKGTDYSKSMVHYHMSIELTRFGQPQKALESTYIARDIFAQTVNIKRLTAISFQIAGIYSRCGYYSEAEEIFLNCIESFKTIGMLGQLQIVYNNLMWHYVRAKEYKKLILKSDEALRVTENDSRILFYLSYAYYKQDNRKKAYEIIKQAKNIVDNDFPYLKAVVYAFYVYLSNTSNERKEKHLLNAHQKAHQFEDIDLVLFTEEVLKDFYKETNQKEKYYQSVENLMNYYKNRSL